LQILQMFIADLKGKFGKKSLGKEKWWDKNIAPKFIAFPPPQYFRSTRTTETNH